MNPFLVTTDDATAVIGAVTVTPNDSADITPSAGPARPTRALIFGATGAVKMTMADGSVITITIPAAVLGFIQNFAVTRIWATGTTVAASSITALY